MDASSDRARFVCEACRGLVDGFHAGSSVANGGSDDYRSLMQTHGVLPNLSRKGNCHDNAVAESFFSNLKSEVMHHRVFNSKDEAEAVVNDYIEVYYNRGRLHQTLDYQPPASFEAASGISELRQICHLDTS